MPSAFNPTWLQVAKTGYQLGKSIYNRVQGGKTTKLVKRKPRRRRKEVVDLVTGQKDYARIAVGKRRTKRQKKWRRFRKRVQRAVATEMMRSLNKTASQRITVDATALSAIREGTITNGGVGRQAIATITLCGYSQSGQQINDDLNEMLQILSQVSTAPTAQGVTFPVYVKSALWEIMLKNPGTNAQYVDVYHWVARKNSIYDPSDIVAASDAQVNSGTIPSGATSYLSQPAVEDYGWTPYQNRNIMRTINIYRKERYLMPAGDTIQIEKRIAINKVFRKEQTDGTAANVQNKLVRGMTHGLMFIVYGTPGASGNSAITGTCDLNISVNKTIYFGKGSMDNGPTATTGINGDTDWRTTT